MHESAAPAPTTAQKRLRIVILVVGTVTFLCFLGLSPILRSIISRDRADARPQIGVGTVEQIIPPHIEENAKPIPTQVWVRVNGTLAAAETAFGSAQLHIGGQARVTYRVGKSGRIYVDTVEPLDPQSNPPQK